MGGVAGLKSGRRNASSTTVNAAFLAGTDVTGGEEGAPGRDRGEYNGGLENYPRFHEDWIGATLSYRGSFVSLGAPRHVNGRWCGTGMPCGIYEAPVRAWSFETNFNTASKLPPLSPRFVLLKQELFSRSYER